MNIRSFYYWLSTKMWFLKLKNYFARVSFRLERWVYYLKRNFTDVGNEIVILVTLIKTTISSLLFTSVILLLLIFLGDFTGTIEQTNAESYDNLLIAVASITGIFLSLYFTGLNTVIGGIYARSSSVVRNLFIQERLGNFSVKYIISITLVCLGLLLLSVVFNIRPRAAVYFIVPTGCFAILFFSQLGKRAFSFFDPTTFAGQLQSDLNLWSLQATSKGPSYLNPLFQKYYRTRAVTVLICFTDINKIALSENQLKNVSLTSFIRSIVYAYTTYINVKKGIPSNSLWFPFISKFKEWYLSSDIIVPIAALAKTELIPTNEPNHYWVEDWLEEIEINTLKQLSENVLNTQTIDLMNYFFLQFSEIGKVGEIERALEFHSRIVQILRVHLDNDLPKLQDIHYEDNNIILFIGILDLLCAYEVTLVASFFSIFESLQPTIFSRKIRKHGLKKREVLYNTEVPFRLLHNLENIYEKLEFEYQVEKKIITQDWYIDELIAREIAYFIVEGVTLLISKGSNFFKNGIASYSSQNQIIKTVAIIDRGLEMSEKLKTLVLSADLHLENIYKFKTIDLPWPEWEKEEKYKIVDDFQKELVSKLAIFLPSLSVIEKSNKIPDYFGKSLVIIENECFRSLDENDFQYYQSIFSKFFTSVLLIFERIKVTTENWEVTNRLLSISEPVMDLLMMSGYTLIYAELHQKKEFWAECMRVWDNFLNNEGVDAFMKQLEFIYTYRKRNFVSTPRDRVRAQWEMLFRSKVRSLPRNYVSIVGMFRSATEVIHPSTLIKVISGHEEPISFFYKPDEVFIDLYLNKKEVSKNIDFKLRYPISEMLVLRDQQNQDEE